LLRADVTREVDRQIDDLKVTSDGLTAAYQSTRNSLLLILGLGVVIVAGAAMLIAQRGIAAPLQGLAKVMEVLARGDFSAEVTGQQRRDEVG
ncbi:HAMP domain-containing protein, partial [Vibrio parahaemolyticus]